MRARLTFCLIASALAACGRAPQSRPVPYPLPKDADIATFAPGAKGGTFIIGDAGDPSTLNPLISEDDSSSTLIGLLMAGMTSYDYLQDKVVPGLAKSWDIAPDNKTFTFHLREGIKWSDGAPFTADDVVFTFECIYNPKFPNRAAFSLSIDGVPFKVEKVDDLTVRVISPDVYGPLLMTAGGVEILPKHKLAAAAADGSLLKAWNIGTAKNTPGEIVGLGPFCISSYSTGERMVLTPNPHYYRADSAGTRLPYYDRLIIKFVPDSTALTTAFATGQTDASGIGAENVAWVKRAEKTYNFTVFDRGPSTSSSFIWFNLNPGKDKDSKPFVDPVKQSWFADVRFRQAISYGIDRQGIVDGVLFGRGAPLWGPESPSNAKWFNPNVKQYPHDPAKALALLQEAGFSRDADGLVHDKQGRLVEFTLSTNQESPVRLNMATVFKENMKQIGITVTLQFLDFGTLVNKISESFNYDSCLMGFTGGGDPVGGMSIYPSKGRMHQWNPSQKSPATPWEAKIDDLMIRQLKTINEDERRKYYHEVQLIMSEQVPCIYLITPKAFNGLKNKWSNYDLTPIYNSSSSFWNIEKLYQKAP